MPGMTPMVQRIMVACAVIWLVQLVIGWNGLPITDLGAVSVPGVFQNGFLWQPFTYMWLHSTESPWHLIMNMFSLWMFGGQLEMAWGSRRFLRFYLLCGTGAGLIILGWNALIGEWAPTLGASGAIYGVLTAFSLLWPDRTIMLLFPPIHARDLVHSISVRDPARNGWPGQRQHVGHLGGVIVAGASAHELSACSACARSLPLAPHAHRNRLRARATSRAQAGSDDDRPTFH
jgi:membrane associated rhomboid family serine protease